MSFVWELLRLIWSCQIQNFSQTLISSLKFPNLKSAPNFIKELFRFWWVSAGIEISIKIAFLVHLWFSINTVLNASSRRVNLNRQVIYWFISVAVCILLGSKLFNPTKLTLNDLVQITNQKYSTKQFK